MQTTANYRTYYYYVKKNTPNWIYPGKFPIRIGSNQIGLNGFNWIGLSWMRIAAYAICCCLVCHQGQCCKHHFISDSSNEFAFFLVGYNDSNMIETCSRFYFVEKSFSVPKLMSAFNHVRLAMMNCNWITKFPYIEIIHIFYSETGINLNGRKTTRKIVIVLKTRRRYG